MLTASQDEMEGANTDRNRARPAGGIRAFRASPSEPRVLALALTPSELRWRPKQCTGIRRLTCRLYREVDLSRFRCSRSRRVQRTAWPESKWLRPSAREHGRFHRGRP